MTDALKVVWLLWWSLVRQTGSASYQDSSTSQCSATFHVWQPGQDAQQTISEINFKMDNLTSHTRTQFAETKAKLWEELSNIRNWTHAVDRRVFQIQADRMDDELTQMKFSASNAKVKVQIDAINVRVDNLEQALFNVQGKLNFKPTKAAENGRTHWLSHEDLPQQQGISRDVTQELRNGISDLKAEWMLLKRDVVYLKKDTQNLITAQGRTANDTVALKNALAVTGSAAKRLESKILTLTDRQEKLSAEFADWESNIAPLRNQVEQNREKMLTNSEKIAALQARANAFQDGLKDFERTVTGRRVEESVSTGYIDPRATYSVGPIGVENSVDEHDVVNQASGDTSKYFPEEKFPRDCHELYLKGNRVSSVYHIHVDKARYIMPVYCEMINKTGYTVIQRRLDGSISFNRGWSEYKQGFGNQYGEMWLGNELIHQLSAQKKYTLRIDFWDWDGAQHYAEYSRFFVDDEGEKYRLHVGGFSGTSGDSMSYHNRMAFSTEDMDNDLHERHCAADNKGGWWYNKCFYSQLNGLYHTAWYSQTSFPDGIVWFTLKNNEFYSLKRVEMKLRPNAG